VAVGSVSCTGLTCSFDGSQSSDPDGSIVSSLWTFGDGNTSTALTTTETYAASGTYPVTLTVTDNQGATDVWSGSVSPVGGDAPVSFVGAAAFTGSSASPSVIVPPGVSTGDTELVFITVNTVGVTSSPTGLSGWTQVAKLTNSTMETTVFQRTASSGDSGVKVSVPLTKSERLDLQLVDYSGVASGTVPITTAVDNYTGSHVAPAIAVTAPGSWVLSYWADRSTTTTGWTLPASVTGRKVTVGTGGGRISAATADSGATVATGTYAALTATTANSTAGHGDMMSVVLAPQG
jgi:hypothetical protein